MPNSFLQVSNMLNNYKFTVDFNTPVFKIVVNTHSRPQFFLGCPQVGDGGPRGLLSVLYAPSWRPCAGRDYPEEGPEGGAAWNDDVGLE